MPAQRELKRVLQQRGIDFDLSVRGRNSQSGRYDFLHLFPHVVDRATMRLQGRLWASEKLPSPNASGVIDMKVRQLQGISYGRIEERTISHNGLTFLLVYALQALGIIHLFEVFDRGLRLL